MDIGLLALGLLVFAISVGLVGRRLKKDERARAARQWEERERQLDRRKPVATPEDILERRARRG